jgi:hypothetical protein
MIRPPALYRQAESGIYYDNPKAAGTVSAVICKQCRDGVERKPGESLEFIKQVAAFWKDHDCSGITEFIEREPSFCAHHFEPAPPLTRSK